MTEVQRWGVVYGRFGSIYYHNINDYYCSGAGFLCRNEKFDYLRKGNGAMAALGIASGHIVYSLLAVFGIIFILANMYYVFVTIKILGAIYLIYLGIRSIISARQSMNFSTSQMKAQRITYLSSYRQGFFSTILNPKALLYYISILPQFLSTGEAVTSKIAILTAIVTTVILLWFIFCVYIFNILRYCLLIEK